MANVNRDRKCRSAPRPMVVLAPVLAAALRWLAEAAGSAVPAAAQLPANCREAVTHALLTCAIGPPRYFAPGWGPCSHCWGWLCAGLLLGVFGAFLLWGRVSTRHGPPPAWSVAASELLHCMAVGGETELQALAEAAGQTPTELLCGIFQRPEQPQWRRILAAANQHLHCPARCDNLAKGRPGDRQLTQVPPDDGPTARRRERALHALAQMQLLPPLSSPREGEEHGTGSETDAAITLSDTLSATTPFASPRGEVQAELSGAMAPTAPDEATPGFTPPRSPDLPPREPETSAEPLPWQDARPPSSMPGERNSWLFVPLLQAAAGNLTARATHAWRSCPQIGTRFNELVSLLRDAPPPRPTGIARTLLAVAECEAHDGGWHILQEDHATATALTALPDEPLPLAAALPLCMAPDGYLTAAAQSALLESYAGALAAATARSLADDVRRTLDAREPHAATRRRRRRARHRSAQCGNAPPRSSTGDEGNGVPTCPAAAD
ncbi:hypothetical protein AK812_SmicGene37745, partial [Symbiodinium microadriaticum]